MAYEASVSYLLNTTDDNVVETPDESLTVAIYVPGMFPSFLGDLIAVVSIEVHNERLHGYTGKQPKYLSGLSRARQDTFKLNFTTKNQPLDQLINPPRFILSLKGVFGKTKQ